MEQTGTGTYLYCILLVQDIVANSWAIISYMITITRRRNENECEPIHFQNPAGGSCYEIVFNSNLVLCFTPKYDQN